MKPRQLSATRQVEVPLAGILAGAAGGSVFWIIAALIVWTIAR
jgi:hypothetical protein